MQVSINQQLVNFPKLLRVSVSALQRKSLKKKVDYWFLRMWHTMTQATQCLLAMHSVGLIYHLLHNSARSEIKVLLHNCQQFLLCLLRGAIIKQRYREGLCHSNGIRHLQKMSAFVQYLQLHAVANQEHACASLNLHSLQWSQQPTNGPHPTHYMPHLCNPFSLHPAILRLLHINSVLLACWADPWYLYC